MITIIVCSVSESAMITECWTPQSNHRDTFFSIYLVTNKLTSFRIIYNSFVTVNKGYKARENLCYYLIAYDYM